jgi:hypothetical protein
MTSERSKFLSVICGVIIATGSASSASHHEFGWATFFGLISIWCFIRGEKA